MDTIVIPKIYIFSIICKIRVVSIYIIAIILLIVVNHCYFSSSSFFVFAFHSQFIDAWKTQNTCQIVELSIGSFSSRQSQLDVNIQTLTRTRARKSHIDMQTHAYTQKLTQTKTHTYIHQYYH